MALKKKKHGWHLVIHMVDGADISHHVDGFPEISQFSCRLNRFMKHHRISRGFLGVLFSFALRVQFPVEYR